MTARTRGLLIALVAIVAIALIGVLIFLALPVISVIRDLAIILLALETMVLIGIFIFIGLKVLDLVSAVSREAGPVLQTTGRAANTVAGTADFVSRLAVTPIIRVATAAAAASRFVQVLLRLSRGKQE